MKVTSASRRQSADPSGGGGEIGERVRRFPWAETPLGPAIGWSRSLTTAVDILLACPQPMLLWWGDALTTLYNDAAVAALGAQHPAALGRSAADVWSDRWESIGPVVAEVLAAPIGARECVETSLSGHNGDGETLALVLFGVAGDDGKCAGVMCVAAPGGRRVGDATIPRAEGRASGASNGVPSASTTSAGREFTAELDLRTLVQKVTDAGVAATGAEFGAFFYNTVTDDGESYVLFTLSGAPREAFENFGLPRTTPLFGPTFRGEGVVRIDDVLADPRYGTMEPHLGMPTGHLPVRSYLAAPVVSGNGAVIGGLFFGHSQVGVFTDQSERAVLEIAADAAVAIDNAQLYDQARREIRQRTRVEHELRESERRYRLVVEAANDYIFDWDLAHRRVVRSDGAEAMFGYDPSAPDEVASWGRDHIHAEDLDRVLASLQAAQRGGGDFWREEFRFRRGDGTYAQVLARAHFIRDGEGAALRIIGSMTDLTETRRIKEALETSEKQAEQTRAQLAAIVASSDDAIISMTLDGRIVSWNAAAEQIFGYAAADAIGQPIELLIPPDRQAEERDILARLQRGERLEHFDTQRLTQDGRLIDVALTISPLRDATGRVIGASKIARDVTQRKRSDEVARETEERFSQFMRHLPGLAWIKDSAGRYVYANAAAERAFGKSRTELYGHTDDEVFDPDTAAQFRVNDQAALTAEAGLETIETLEHEDGLHHSLVSKFSIPGPDGNPALIGGIAIDVTQRMEAERALRDSEERFRSIMTNAPVAVFIKDLAGRYTLSNPLAADILGRPHGAEGYTDHELLTPDVADRIRAIDLEVMASGRPSEQEELVERPGYLGEFLSVKFPMRDSEGHVVGVCGVAVDITERKRAQQALRESDQRLRLATQTGKLGVWDWDIENDRISWSESLYAIHGVNPEWFSETVGDFSALVHPDDRERVARSIQDAMNAETAYELEFRAVRPDGQVIWLFTNAVVLRRDGRPIRMLGATMDITQLKHGETALRDSEERFRTLASHAPVGIFHSEPNGDTAFVNENWCAMAGMTPEEARGRGWIRALHPEDRDRVVAGWEDSVRRGEQSSSEFRFMRPDGVVTWLQGNAAPLRSAEGEVVGYIGTVADITQHKRAEDALRNSERMYRAIGESIDYGIWVCDADGRNVYLSESFLQLVGLTQEEASNYGWTSVLHPDDVEQTIAAWQQCVLSGLPWDIEHRCRGVDGRWRPVLARGVPVRDDSGKITAWVGINLDISELKQVENELRESEARFRTMADTAPVLIWINGVGGCQFVNREYLRFAGCRPEDVSGMNWTELLHASDRDAYVQAYLAAFERKGPFEAQARMRRADGEYRWVSSTGVPRLRADGTFLGYVGCSVDVTDIKASEAALREADRRKDDFLAMLGHELRNPLAGIVTGAQVLSMLDLAGDAQEMQGVIARQAAHMSQIVDDLLDVSRIARGKLTLRHQHVNLSRLVRDAVEDYRRSHELTSAELRVQLPLGDVWAWMDPTRITQAITNIVHNSIKFSAGVHDILVGLSVDPERALATISISDHGIGMTRETLDRIFEPFNQADTSLERSRGGLGLGLTLAKGLVELHGGTVAADSPGLGKGSTFLLALPSEPAPTAAAPTGEQVVACTRRVLIIDDRRDAILPLNKMLQIEGHEVVSAMDGPSGIMKAREFIPEVVLCDIGLAGDMNGYQVTRALRSMPEFATAYIVAVTGYGQEEDRRRAKEAGFDYHLTKPLDQAQVTELMTRMPRF